ncbi:MAG TPA: AI-2E family transporter [Solirubrobacteraceae bacterium]|nr:AI-2E family transporter [Solirubrobacteraceae bacterium]
MADELSDIPDTPPPPPPAAGPVVVARWVQLVMLPLAVLALYAVAHAAGVVLLLFLLAAVIALILNPLVEFVQRARIPRTVAVTAVYAAIFTLLPFLGFLAAGPVSEQATSFANDVPALVDDADDALDGVQEFFDDQGVNVKIKGDESALTSLQDSIVKGSGEIVTLTGELLRRFVELSFYVILVIVISIYMLIYAPRIGTLVRSVMPAGDGTPQDDYPTRVQRAVFGYVRGQLLFSAIMGLSAGVSLWIFGVLGIFPDGRTYAFAFGLFFGVMELIPYVGPVLGATPPVLVALVQDPLMALWVALLFVALQQLEGHIVAPNVFGRTLRLNPLLVILALLLGGQIYGLVGALVALPIAAVLRETVVYLRRHLVFEPWGATSPLLIGAERAPPPPGAAAHGQAEASERVPTPRG